MKKLLITLAYTLGLRKAYNNFMRFVFDSKIYKGDPNATYIHFDGLIEFIEFASGAWKYQKDPVQGLIDYNRDPGISIRTMCGDCDDYHHLIAHAARAFGATNVRLINLVYTEWAHTMCAFDYEGKEYIVDWKVVPRIQIPENAGDFIFEVVETPELNLLKVIA